MKRASMSYQDPLAQRSCEHNAMSAHDVVENSALSFRNNVDEAHRLIRVWQVLGADYDGDIKNRLRSKVNALSGEHCA